MIMKTIKYVIFKEGEYYVAQCLNVDVSSFGNTIDDATRNLKEALDLYFDDNEAVSNYHRINEALLGEMNVKMV